MITHNPEGGFSRLNRTICPIFGDHYSFADIMPAVDAWTAFHVDNTNILKDSVGEAFRVCPALLLENLGGSRTLSATMSVSEPPQARPRQSGYYSSVQPLGWGLDVSALLRDADGRVHEDESVVDGAVRQRILVSADNPCVDQIFVFSSDGGMISAMHYACSAGQRVVVLAWRKTLHPALAAAANGFAFIDNLGAMIGRPLVHQI